MEKVLTKSTLATPGLLAFTKAQQGRDTSKYHRNKREALPWLDEVMNMRSEVEHFNDAYNWKTQSDNTFWYFMALITIFPVYFEIGEKETARKAYELAKTFAGDKRMPTPNSISSLVLTDFHWKRLNKPWYAKVELLFTQFLEEIGKHTIRKVKREG